MAELLTVIGAGGIGGSLAAGLKLAGEAVRVVEVGPHLAAIRRNGLRLEGVRGEHTVRFDEVCAPDELRGPVRLVFVATRANRTADALDALAPHLAEDGLVVSVQNGLNPHLIARRVGPERTIPCMVHMVCALLEPGRVCRYAEGDFYVGQYVGSVSNRAVRLAERMSPAVPTHAVDNVWGYVWCKLIHVAQNVAVALVDAPAGAVREPDWVRRVLVAVELEVLDASVASGVRLEPYERIDPQVLLDVRSPESLQRAVDMLPRESAKGYNGMQRELSRGVKTEVDEVCGEIGRIGQAHGLRMAITSRLVELIHDIEDQKRERGWSTLRELEPLSEQLLAERMAPMSSGSTRS